ncbi:hypothetical protein [Nonomuraea sp. NEAU-A123]|uniref:hypothetical protein n=1 Tax=Nonomuraea sp. NEAU-A123 TaxID=2839649 RepID=UPI001BE49C19|nr:hypothetical protein [Nonomuraea sp. NEAU-A123]MBT2228375.1 hypothetical protein [Nonomuraea sp. NEAU-A123]
MVRVESRNLLARLGAILAVAAVAVSLGPAKVDAAVAQTGEDRYCAVLIGKATEGKPSPVLARACDDTSAANAREKMLQETSEDSPKSTVRPLAADLLMTWYSDTDYHGASTNIFGDDGPCDRAGYRLDVNSATFGIWSRILSSARGAGPCNTARFANRAGTSSQEFGLPVPYLGSLLNDNVGTIWVYNR